MVDGRYFAPAGFSLRLRAFMIDFLILTVLSAGLVALFGLPAPNPQRELEVSMKVMRKLMALELPDQRLMREMDELQRPQRFIVPFKLALCAAYFILFHGLAGYSLGKAATGLRVLRRNGAPLHLGHAALRYLPYLLLAKLGYGTFTMLFDPERRTVHDMLAGTNVYRELRWR